MAIVIGGHGLGLQDGSLGLLNRNDLTSKGTMGLGVESYLNVANGNLLIQERDAFLPSRGADFALVRTYNSRGAIQGSPDGWWMSSSVTLSSHQDTPAGSTGAITNYTVRYGDGSELHFDFDASRNLWVSTDGAGAYETLQVLPGNTGNGEPKYVVTRADQSQYQFDKNFTLLSITDTNGVTTEFTYQGGLIQTIRDDTGHTIVYQYSGSKLTSIVDRHAGQADVTLVRYAYSQSQLTQVIDRFGHTTTYTYNNNGLLIKISLPFQQTVNGQLQTFETREIQFAYAQVDWSDHPHLASAFDTGSQWVVTSITDALGGVTSFDYDFQFNPSALAPNDRDLAYKPVGGRSFAGGTTRVVDAMGNGLATSNAAEFQQKRVALGFAADVNALTQPQKDALRQQFSLSYTFDPDGYITQVVDQQGFQTTYTYGGKTAGDPQSAVNQDNLLSVTDRNGWGATNSDSSYFRALRKDLNVVDAAGNGKLVANLTANEKSALLAKFTTLFTYDARGNLLTSTDGLGNQTSYTYTAFNKVASATSAMGNALATLDDLTPGDSFYRNKRVELGFGTGAASGLTAPQKTALRDLYTTTYSYDARQNLITRTDAGGDVTQFEYDVFGNLTKRTVLYRDAGNVAVPAKNQVTSYAYDPFGNNVSIVDGEGNTTTKTYDHFGNLLTSVDGRGGVSTYTYDADNRLLTSTDPEGHVTVNTYDAVGNRISVTDANGHTVTQIFDRNNLLIATIDPAVNAALTRNTAFKYDILGNRTEATDAEGRKTTYTFDARRQLVDAATPQVLNGSEALVSYHTTYAYDGESNLVTRTDNNGNVTQILYTPNGLLKRETDPIGNVTEFLFDANLAQVQITIGAQLAAALRRVLKFSRDEEDQVTSDTDALGNITRYGFDAPGNVVSVTDANGHRTDYEYDKNNRLIKETRPTVTDPVTGLPIRYTVLHQYDANGNEVSTTDENGHITSYAFDKDNRQVMVTDGNGIKTVFTWDSRDNQTQVAIGVDAHIDANSHAVIDNAAQAAATSFVYDEFNQLIAATDGVGNALVSSDLQVYQNIRTELGFAPLVAGLSAPDKTNLLNRFTERYEYDRVGNRTKLTDHLGRVSTLGYDALDRVQSRTEALGTAQQRTTALRYDGNANLVKLSDSLGRATRFTFDGNDRLVDETDPLGVVTHHDYDHVGNVTADTEAFGTAQARTTSYLYDLNDRLTRQTDPEGHVKQYEYDAVGNRLKEIDARGGATQYVFDALDRNIKIIDPLNFQTRLEYDGVGNNITIIDANGGIERLQYDGANRYIQTTDPMGRVTRLEYDRQNNVVTQTTASGLPEAEVTRFVYDAEGNLRQVTDAAGKVSTQGFDEVYNLTRFTDNNGHTTTTAFDALNRQIRVTDALGGVTTYTYDLEDNQLSETDALGHTRSFQYDAKDQLIVQTDALGTRTVYAYDAVGNQVSITRAANTPTPSTNTFVYNKDDKLVRQTDALGNTTTYAYDANHNVVSTTDALGRVTTYAYDAADQVTSITDPLGHVTHYQYDGKGNRVRVTDARGNAETTFYDLDDEVILTVDGEGNAVARSYDGNGNVIATRQYMTPLAGVIDPALLPAPVSSADDRLTTFAYDPLNRLVKQTDALGGIALIAYDAAGNKVSETDENGHTTQYVYDALDRLIRQSNPLAGVRSFTYDAVGNQVSETDENGHARSFAYDLEDRLIRETDALGGVKTFSYDAVDNRISQTDQNGHTTTYVYDLEDRLISETNPLLGVKTYTYDAVGNLLSATDENGHTTRFAYDADDRLITETDALGGVHTTTYDAVDNIVAETDENGHTTTSVYDANDRLVSQTNPLGGVRRIEYDAVGNQVKQTDENGHATSFAYDKNDRLIKQIDPLLGERLFTYDAVGNQLSETDENGHTTTFSYDANDRIATQTDTSGKLRSYAYDAVGNQIAEIDENSHAVSYAYDALDRLITETDALGGQQTTVYDAVGNLLTQTDENGHTTTYVYDDLDRRVTQTDALGGVRSFTYDQVGNLLTETDEIGHVTTLTYDANDRLIRQTDPLNGQRSFSYDSVGNRLSETDENGHATTFVYDDKDRLIRQTNALGGIRAFTYDAAGNQLSETDENTHTTTFVYDANDRLVRTTDPLGGQRSYAYDAVGNQRSQTDENGHTTTTVYDANDRVVRETDALGNFKTSSYDGVGNVLSQTDENGHTTTFAYDAIDRLVERSDALGGRRTFTFDAAGNQLTDTDENGHTTASVYDADNRRVRETNALGAHKEYSFDAAGNQLSEKDENGHVTTFQYDANDRLLKQTDPLGGERSFTYDAVGNQLTETDENGHATTSEYDANNRLTRQTGPLGGIKTFSYDAVGNTLTETDENSHTVSHVYDANDRVVSETDPSGRVTRFFYDAAGNNTQIENPLGDRVTNYFDAVDQLVMSVDAEGVVLESVFDAAGNAVRQVLRAQRVTGPISVSVRPTVVVDAKDQPLEFRFDALNRLIETQDAEGGIATRTFDAAGNRLTQSDANGNVTAYTYDANDRLTSETNALLETKTFSYDAAGNTVTETDAAGSTTTYTYDANDRVLTETNALGGVRILTYDAVGNLLTEKDETNRTTTFAYDANDRTTSEKDNAGASKLYTYDAVGNRLTETDESGRTVTFAFNAVNLVTGETDALGNTTVYRYDDNNNSTEVEDAEGSKTISTYDGRGQVIAETDSLGNATQYEYDTAGNQVRIVDPNGQAQTYYFDRNNRVVLMVDAEGFATATTYDANGNIVSFTLHATALAGPLDPAVLPTVTPSAQDRTTTYTWDALDRKTSMTDPRGVTVNYAYDNVGNEILRTQDLAAPVAGPVTLFAAAAAASMSEIHDYYDANHRRIASLTSEGVLTTYGYDAAGREAVRTEYLAKYSAPADGLTPPTPLVDDTGRITTTAYDSAGRKSTETGPTGLVTKFIYDGAGREIERIEGFGSGTERSFKTRYDAAGREFEKVDPAGTVTRFVLDRAGKVKEKHEAFGLSEVRVTKYEYFGNGRVKAEIDALNVRTEYKYNANGDLTERKTAAGIAGVERTEKFIYDKAGFLAEQVNGEGERATFEYDSAGNRTRITVAPDTAAERVLTYRYDGNNRLIEETDGNGVMTSYVYDGAGNEIETIQAANQPGFERSTTFAYDTDNRLISVTNPEGGVVTYEYDAVGNRKTITDANGAVTQNTYDALGRLKTSVSGVGGPHGGVKIDNAYDLFGNISSTTQSFADDTQASTTSYAYDVLNRQTVVTDGEGFSSEFTYDRFGNQTGITRGSYLVPTSDANYSMLKAARVHMQTTTFVYDELDRLKETTDGVGNKVTNDYDARGNRLTQTSAAGTAAEATVTFRYDLADRVIQKDSPTGGRVKLEYDAAGNQTAIETLQSGSGASEVVLRTTFTYDGNGRATQEVDPYGTITEHEIDVYGNETGIVFAKGTSDERTARTEFDANGNQSATIDALGNRTEFVVDAVGNRIKETDPLGRITHYYYNVHNQQIAQLDPEGFLVTYKRDVDGNITETRAYLNRYTAPVNDLVASTPAVADPFRWVTSTFDQAGNLASQTEADGILKEFNRDSTGLLLSVTTTPSTDAARVARTASLTPQVQTFEYDGAGRLIKFVNANDVEESYQYDATNNRTQERIHNPKLLAGNRVDPDRVTNFTFDLDNRVTAQSFDNGNGITLVQSLVYDFAGNVVETTDFNGNVKLSAYDLNNQLTTVTDALGHEIRYVYDKVGNQVQITDAKGKTTDLKYDKANRQIELKAPSVNVFTLAGNVPSLPSGGFADHRPTTTTVYDAAGNVIQVIDADGNKTTSYYDGNNNKIAEVNGDFGLRTFAYDATGAVVSATQFMTRLDSSNAATHDPAIRPTAPAGSEARTVTTAYDAAGRATLTTYPQVAITTLSGTTGNSPSATETNQSPTESSLYDAFGELVESVDRNGFHAFAYYDALGRQVAVVDVAGYLTETSYDDQDNVVQQRRYRTPLNTATLSAATLPSAAVSDADIVDRIYDAAGRLIEEQSANVKVGQSAGSDVFERVRTTYAYDKNGNKTSQTFAAGSSDAVTERYYYDAANQQVAVVSGGRTLNVFSYDENGNKTQQTRFINKVPTSVDLSTATLAAIQVAVSANLTQDETSTFVYDAANRLTSQSDIVRAAGETPNDAANDITMLTAYDPMGNVTRRVDADGFVSQLGYNAVGKITETLSPNGAASFVEYDTGGLKTRSWTGGLPGTSAQQAINVTASVAGDLKISWNQPGAGAQSWVVWDTAPHSVASGSTPDSAYPHKTGVVGSGNVSASIPVASLSAGTVVFFRVVSQDSFGNIAWTDENDLTVPARYDSLVVRESGADLQIDVHFVGTVTSPVLKFGPRNSTLPNSVNFVSLGGGNFRATLVSPSNPQSLAFQVQWVAAGATLTGAATPFEAAQAHVAIGTQIGIDVPQVNGASVASSQIVVVDGVQDLESDTKQINSRLNFDPEIGTAPGSHPYFVYWGNRVATSHTVAVVNEDHQSTTVLSDTNTFNNADPPVQTARTVVLGWNHSYHSHVNVTLNSAEVATISGSLNVAVKAAGTGDIFSAPLAMTNNGGGSFSATLSLNPGAYDILVFYTNTSGQRVIVEWRRFTAPSADLPANVTVIDTSGPFDFGGQSVTSGGVTDTTFPFSLSRTIAGASPAAYTGNSLTVTATERNGTIIRAGNGTLSVDPGLYAGPHDANDAGVVLAVGTSSASSGPGSKSSNGLTSETYFTEIKYNALGQRVGTNEDTGQWRTFGVDANGNALTTRVYGTQQDEIDHLAPIVTFATFDARGRELKSFDAAVAVAGQSGIERAVTVKSYDQADRVVSVLDPGNTTARQFQYDGAGNLIREIDALGQTTRRIYDRRGNAVQEIDARNNVEKRVYDSADNLITETNALNQNTTYTYDAFGRRLTTTNPLSQVSSFAYDQHDRLVSDTNAESEVTHYYYDKRDHQVWLQDGNNHWSGTAYDSVGRPTHTYSFVGGSPADLAAANAALASGGALNDKLIDNATQYDVFGNKTAEIDGIGRKRIFSYGAFGRLLTTSVEDVTYTGTDAPPLAYSSSIEYDRFGRATKQTSDRGQNITRTYDDAGRLTKVDDTAIKVSTEYTYDIAGRRAGEVIKDNSPTTPVELRNISQTYYANGDLKRWGDTVTATSLNYFYDATGNIIQVRSDDSTTLNHLYSYDAANRIATFNQTGTLNTFTYDNAGNRKTWNDGSKIFTYTYDNAGRVTKETNSADAAHKDWVYDNAGNITDYREFSDATTQTHYTLSTYQENNVISVSDSDNIKTTTTYDKAGKTLSQAIVDSTDSDDVKNYTYTFAYNADATQKSVTATGSGDAGGNSSSTYNANGDLIRIDLGQGDGQDSTEFKTFTYNNDGQILSRFHDDGDNDTANKTTRYVYANGHPVGEVDDAGGMVLDDGNYDLVKIISEDFPEATVSGYSVRLGDTLQSIAAQFYGNPGLWWVIAAANGLTGAEPLHEGMRLQIPNSIQNGGITSDTHALYKEGDIVGSKLPNLAAPPSSGDQCAVIAAIILIVVVAILAVVITIVTVGIAAPAAAAALGVTATSAAGIIIGVAVGAAIGAGIAFAASVITQGILVGFGLQKEFDWKQVAADTVAGAFGGATAGLGKLIEAGLLVGKLARITVAVASAVLEAAGEAARQAIANDGHIDAPWAIALAGAGGAFGALTTRATRITRTVDKAGKTILKVVKKAPAGTIIKGVKGKAVTVFDAAGKKFVLKSADVKLVKTAEGQLKIVKRVGDSISRGQKIRNAFLKTFGGGRTTVSKANDGTKVIKTFELQKVSGKGSSAIFEERLVAKTVTREALKKGKSIKVSDRVKLRMIDGQITRVRRVSDQFTRAQRVSRFFSQKFNVGKFATRTISKGDDGLKTVSRIELRPNSTLGGALEEGRRATTQVTRTTLLKGKKIVLDDRVKLRLVDGQIAKVRRVSDQFSRTQRLQRLLGVGEFKEGATLSKLGSLKKTVRTGTELKPIQTGPLKGVLQESATSRVVEREAIKAGKSVKLNDQVKLVKDGGTILQVRRISDQYTRLERVQRRLGRAFNIGEFAAKRTVSKSNSTGLKKVATFKLLQSKTLPGVLEETVVSRRVTREALTKGKSIVSNDSTKLRLINGKIVKVQRISNQYTKAQRVQRSLGRFFNVGEYATSTTVSKLDKLKKVRTFELTLTKFRSGPLKGQNVFREKAVVKYVRRLSAQDLTKRQLAADAVKNFFSTAATKFKVGGKKAGVFLSDLVNAATDFAPADLFAKAGNKGSNYRVLLGWVGSVGIPVGGNIALGTTYPYEDHPPGPMGYLIKAGVTFGKGLAAYYSGGNDSSDKPDTPATTPLPFTEAVGLPTLKVVLNGQGERALRNLGYKPLREPIEVHAASVEQTDQFSVRDSVELFDSAHGRQHHWLPFDWVKTAAAATTQIFSPFALDRGVGYAESLTANQLVTGQVAQYQRDTVQRFAEGSVGRVPNNAIPVELLSNAAPSVPRVV